jgi:hypothetical protein
LFQTKFYKKEDPDPVGSVAIDKIPERFVKVDEPASEADDVRAEGTLLLQGVLHVHRALTTR